MSSLLALEFTKHMIPIREWEKHDGKVPEEIQEVIDNRYDKLRLVEMYGNIVGISKHPIYGWALLEAGPCIIWMECMGS